MASASNSADVCFLGGGGDDDDDDDDDDLRPAGFEGESKPLSPFRNPALKPFFFFFCFAFLVFVVVFFEFETEELVEVVVVVEVVEAVIRCCTNAYVPMAAAALASATCHVSFIVGSS